MRDTSDRVHAAGATGVTAPGLPELCERADRAGSVVEVQRLVHELARLPGMLDATLGAAPEPGSTGTRGSVVTVPIGPVAWRLALRVAAADDETLDRVRRVVDLVAAAAIRALNQPCRWAPERSAPPPPLYHEITRNARALIVAVDPARGWTPLSDSFTTLLGYDRAHPAVGNLLDLVHPDDQPAALSAFLAACAGRHPGGCHDLRLRTANGDWRTIEFACRSFVDVPEAGVIAYFGLDVTTQRMAEQALSMERGRLLTLVETLRDGVLLLDEEDRLTVANDALRRLLGGAERTLVTVGDWTRLLASLRDSFADGADTVGRLRDVVTARHAVVAEEVNLVDGRVLELDFVPMEGDGRRRGTLIHVRDVTSRVAVRRGLEERNRSLAEAAALNNTFVATVAHELRGPLSSVVAFANLLGDAGSGMLSEDQRTYLDVIDRNANRLLRLIEDLLLLSRLESRTLQLRPGPVRLPDLVRSAVAERAPHAAGAGLRLSADTADGPELVCDETRVNQVIDNLVANAIKFTPAGGSVTVRSWPVRDGWQIEVADTGVGIPAADVPRMFSAFFRGSNVAAAGGRPGTPGTGLGLVVSRAIVELHGGTIQVASTEGVGTTVTVQLPIRLVRRMEGKS